MTESKEAWGHIAPELPPIDCAPEGYRYPSGSKSRRWHRYTGITEAAALIAALEAACSPA